MNRKKFKLITILSNLFIIVLFAWLFITDPINSDSWILLIFITLSMANLYFLVDKSKI